MIKSNIEHCDNGSKPLTLYIGSSNVVKVRVIILVSVSSKTVALIVLTDMEVTSDIQNGSIIPIAFYNIFPRQSRTVLPH